MNKEILKNVGISLVTSLIVVVVANKIISTNQEKKIKELIQSEIEMTKMSFNNKIIKNVKKIKEDIKFLQFKINQLERGLAILNKKIEQKVKVERDNIFITESMKKMLEKLKENLEDKLRKEKNLQAIDTKKITLKSNQLKGEIKKKEKKKEKIIRYHITLPSVLKVTKVERVNNQVYLYLENGDIAVKGSVIDGMQIINIDLQNNQVLVKIIDKNAIEYGKIFKIPFVLVFKTPKINVKPNPDNLTF